MVDSSYIKPLGSVFSKMIYLIIFDIIFRHIVVLVTEILRQNYVLIFVPAFNTTQWIKFNEFQILS